jgi:microcin C transport system substrate-binding protein
MMKTWFVKTCFVLMLCLPAAGLQAQDYPGADWSDQPNPLASPDAYTGGEISIFLGQYPKSFNYYLDPSTQSAQIFGSLYESLLSMNPVTLEYEPGLAERWSISNDKKQFTFHLDRRARWSDGKPITAEDVKWTYEAIMDPKHLTGAHKIDMERFYPPEVLDTHTIRFRTKNVHWRNLGAAGGFYIMPKHVLAGRDFNKVNFEFPVVSGLYKIGKIREGIFLELVRRQDWWQQEFLRNQGTGNFQTLKFRFYAARENAFEAFKKGLIDLYPVYTARLWVNETQGERFDKNWILKQRVYNHHPVGFQGFAMNMRKPPFDDVNVRKAMAYLLDRRKMNRTLMYNQYFLHRSYYEGLYSKETPCPNPLIEFDKGKARDLLKKAGWQVNSSTGQLEKNGQPFSFKFLTRSASTDKFLAIYAEDLKDVGIQLSIDQKDWAAWARDMDEFNYQMTWAAWGPSVFIDPEGMWSSEEAVRKGGNNITGFQNSTVDQLIKAQKQIFDIQKRNDINRRIDHIIASEFPYVLLWNINYTRLLYWNKFGTPDTVLSKYGNESSAYAYWWLDEDSAADLTEALAAKLTLPPRPGEVHFDDIFQTRPTQPLK